MSVFYLVRHAHAVWSLDTARALSLQGRADADLVREILAPFKVEAIYSSSERRARETVEPLASAKDLPIQETDDLRERRLIEHRLDDFVGAVRKTWNEPTFAFPGGESNAEAQIRGVAAFERALEEHPDGEVVLATHGNLLTLILQHFDPTIGFEFWSSLTMPDIFSLEMTGETTARIGRLWTETD